MSKTILHCRFTSGVHGHTKFRTHASKIIHNSWAKLHLIWAVHRAHWWTFNPILAHWAFHWDASIAHWATVRVFSTPALHLFGPTNGWAKNGTFGTVFANWASFAGQAHTGHFATIVVQTYYILVLKWRRVTKKFHVQDTFSVCFMHILNPFFVGT